MGQRSGRQFILGTSTKMFEVRNMIPGNVIKEFGSHRHGQGHEVRSGPLRLE